MLSWVLDCSTLAPKDSKELPALVRKHLKNFEYRMIMSSLYVPSGRPRTWRQALDHSLS